MPLIRKSFQRLHYPVDIFALYVRWYLAYSLSLRNLAEMMTEWGVAIDHSTLHRWVIRMEPLLNKAYRRAQVILAGIELVHMIRKGQYQHPDGDGLSPVEQFYLLVA
ncbi:transposase [Serratia plymuthica]|uniref:transposase n=1 Tax=Serratia plymuthica TaxID=82996 RepID=UPI001F5390F6|nr:transposase [Serratia plymuthica]UNK27361.1 transposase [Serratia plymuthica]